MHIADVKSMMTSFYFEHKDKVLATWALCGKKGNSIHIQIVPSGVLPDTQEEIDDLVSKEKEKYESVDGCDLYSLTAKDCKLAIAELISGVNAEISSKFMMNKQMTRACGLIENSELGDASAYKPAVVKQEQDRRQEKIEPKPESKKPKPKSNIISAIQQSNKAPTSVKKEVKQEVPKFSTGPKHKPAKKIDPVEAKQRKDLENLFDDDDDDFGNESIMDVDEKEAQKQEAQVKEEEAADEANTTIKDIETVHSSSDIDANRAITVKSETDDSKDFESYVDDAGFLVTKKVSRPKTETKTEAKTKPKAETTEKPKARAAPASGGNKNKKQKQQSSLLSFFQKK